jgi:hypothetical protein
MSIQIDDFLRNDRAGYSKLAPWLNDIVALRAKGCSYRAVCRYLALNDVTARPGEVHAFLHRRGREKLVAAKLPTQSRTPATSPVTKGSDGLPKFEWNPRDAPKTPW